MWANLWFFVALCLGVYCWHLYRKYEYYERKYLAAENRADKARAETYKAKAFEGKFNLAKKLISTLRHPHPETVKIKSCMYGPEIYTSWVGKPPSGWRNDSWYFMYGDGRIIDSPRGVGKETTIWPKSKEQLKQFFDDDADILWLYIEIYKTLVKHK